MLKLLISTFSSSQAGAGDDGLLGQSIAEERTTAQKQSLRILAA